MDNHLHYDDHPRSVIGTLVRPRVNALFAQAIKKPLVTVCARAGYGKTRAILDFVRESGIPAVWVQLSPHDNVGSRFWLNYISALERIDKPLAEELGEMGFPNTEDKLDEYFRLLRRVKKIESYVIVFDDLHLIKNAAILRFIERVTYDMPKDRAIIMACHELPQISIAGLLVRNLVSAINEDELTFNETELALYLYRRGSPMDSQGIHEIIRDTKGWPFAIHFIAQALNKSPGYEGYVRNAMKKSIFQLLETEVWAVISEKLRHLLVRLSLLDHLSEDLVANLAKGDESLLAELDQQSAYIRLDSYISAYMIHRLFLDFLQTKKGILTAAETLETYREATQWCIQNGYKIDALEYAEALGDYATIIQILLELTIQIPQDVARYAVGIFDRAPEEAYKQFARLAAMHLRTVISLGFWEEAQELAQKYEKLFLGMTGDDKFRRHALSGLYFYWAILRALRCTVDSNYDFDLYFDKQEACGDPDQAPLCLLDQLLDGAWISSVGSDSVGAPQAYIEVIARSERHETNVFKIKPSGRDGLALGELKFYQCDLRGAESYIATGLRRARESQRFDTVQRALLYTMRIAVWQGNYARAQQIMDAIETQLDESRYAARFITYDIAVGWYHYALRQPERIPGWLHDKFAPYGHASFIDNFGNQMKARYCYLTKSFIPLLEYIEDMRRRESILYGRIEMLALKACVHYQMKDRTAAVSALCEAYETAIPNTIIMPFVELGKDMRTLITAVMRIQGCSLPKPWLGMIGRKAAVYAKHQALFISEYNKVNDIYKTAILAPREKDVLRDIYHGLSRSEIAANQNLSVNTVKKTVNSIYDKLDARNVADIIRISAEQKLV